MAEVFNDIVKIKNIQDNIIYFTDDRTLALNQLFDESYKLITKKPKIYDENMSILACFLYNSCEMMEQLHTNNLLTEPVVINTLDFAIETENMDHPSYDFLFSILESTAKIVNVAVHLPYYGQYDKYYNMLTPSQRLQVPKYLPLEHLPKICQKYDLQLPSILRKIKENKKIEKEIIDSKMPDNIHEQTYNHLFIECIAYSIKLGKDGVYILRKLIKQYPNLSHQNRQHIYNKLILEFDDMPVEMENIDEYQSIEYVKRMIPFVIKYSNFVRGINYLKRHDINPDPYILKSMEISNECALKYSPIQLLEKCGKNAIRVIDNLNSEYLAKLINLGIYKNKYFGEITRQYPEKFTIAYMLCDKKSNLVHYSNTITHEHISNHIDELWDIFLNKQDKFIPQKFLDKMYLIKPVPYSDICKRNSKISNGIFEKTDIDKTLEMIFC